MHFVVSEEIPFNLLLPVNEVRRDRRKSSFSNFVFSSSSVIAIDIDPKKIEMAKQNARVYGVEDRIEFVHAWVI